ncbi:MarR family winged helix-turn-helix transcriptional regulator [Sulfurospirillum diekertiae]|uniref:Multiple antibiotic resistance protein MarR n=1 Tax=Sulfurospirillum diekertiae TaxID=1854492 RepID=A0A1Y0HRN9_9BACT|nr:MarR family transcriptional regulator [Sulfurospirillum diekertiae]ARU49985.1 Multiple antibiotic resistance protein MarR [Sulfurospirillum diekertiae]ASC94775.1 Multiple antibiotic resistance protein MarR [Sulfurospirillum diekertiae]
MKFDMDNSLGFILNKTALLSKVNFNNYLKKYDISPEQWSLIFRVVERSGLTQKELSDSTYKDQANITRSIDRLEQKGFLKRIENPNDRRSFQLIPTQEALTLVEYVAPLSQAFNQRLTQGFSEEEAHTLIVLLKKVHDNLEGEPSC